MTAIMQMMCEAAHLCYMKNLCAFIILFVAAVHAQAETYWPKPAHHKFQVGATFGINGVSAGLADFPGTHWGLYARYGKHTCGFKREWDGEFVKLWGEPFYYERIGIYYGWSAAERYLQWGPQVSFGQLTYNHPTYGNETPLPQNESIYGEVAINGLMNVRGNGVGARIFFNLNKFSPILGVTMYFQLGYAWNSAGQND